MDGLRNPFAVRDGNIILIEDLSGHERGLQCRCRCPACDGEFIARMGDVKIHHFAHSKNACDEVLAYTTGLYRLIQQILSGGGPFNVPALVVSYSFPPEGALNKSNISRYVSIASGSYSAGNKSTITVSPGRRITFDSAEIVFDNKNHIQAIELTYLNSRMAIKVMPPDTVCKAAEATAHKDMATLVLDFTGDMNVIQTSNTEAFRKHLLSDSLRKRWIQNPKIEKAFPELIAMSEKALQEHQERERQREEERKQTMRQQAELRRTIAEQQAARREEQKRLEEERKEAERKAALERQREKDSACFEQIQNRDFRQAEHIIDSCGNRWIQCERCGERKMTSDFSVYGGATQIGLCTACARAKLGQSSGVLL
jgi:hypothetical protein